MLEMSKGSDVVDDLFRVEKLEFQDLAGKLRTGARKALTASQSLRFENTFEFEEENITVGKSQTNATSSVVCRKALTGGQSLRSAKNEQDLCLKILLTSFQDMIRYMACIMIRFCWEHFKNNPEKNFQAVHICALSWFTQELRGDRFEGDNNIYFPIIQCGRSSLSQR